MSLQNRIKNILYQKADLMGYGGDGGYLQGSTRQMYADKMQLARDNYPKADDMELKKLVRHYVKAELGLHNKPYNPRIGLHQNKKQRAAAQNNIRSAKLMAYRQIYDAVMLSPQFLVETAANKRQEAKNLLSFGLDIAEAIQRLNVNLDDYNTYISLPVKGPSRKKFIRALEKYHGIVSNSTRKRITHISEGMGYY